MIEERIKNKSIAEKRKIKSDAIVDLDFKGAFNKNNITVDIEKIEKFGEGGIQLFAKAFSNDRPIGFGKDGSVEIERFIFINPPVLVNDVNGNIRREYTDLETQAVTVRTLREDPLEAIMQSLVHTVKVSAKGYENIVPGKRGSTTLTVNSDAGGDGGIQQNGTNLSWANIRSATGACNAGGDCDVNSATADTFPVRYRAGTSAWGGVCRGFATFDASAIGDSDTINSGTLSLNGTSKTDTIGSADLDVQVYQSSQASATALAKNDFNLTGTTAFSSAITYTNWSTVAYNDYALNASGLANISKTTYSMFAFRSTKDVSGTEPAGAGTDSAVQVNCYFADQTGTANDPKLVVDYTGSSVIKDIIHSGIILAPR